MLRALSAILAAFVLPLIAAQSTIYWPVLSPSSTEPWVIGQKNYVAWRAASDTGVTTFDIELHNFNTTVMTGFLEIALRVPMENLPTGYKNVGGEIEVDLGDDVPTGDGFVLIFMDSLHGAVYALSDTFSIYPAASAPANYTNNDLDLPTATVTATLTDAPNPTNQWAITLNGVDSTAATSTAVNNAGDAGSGSS